MNRLRARAHTIDRSDNEGTDEDRPGAISHPPEREEGSSLHAEKAKLPARCIQWADLSFSPIADDKRRCIIQK